MQLARVSCDAAVVLRPLALSASTPLEVPPPPQQGQQAYAITSYQQWQSASSLHTNSWRTSPSTHQLRVELPYELPLPVSPHGWWLAKSIGGEPVAQLQAAVLDRPSQQCGAGVSPGGVGKGRVLQTQQQTTRQKQPSETTKPTPTNTRTNSLCMASGAAAATAAAADSAHSHKVSVPRERL